MGRLHWHRRFHENALAGMRKLSLEERGAYNTVLDLIYMHEDRLEDDDRYIAGWCDCDMRIWKRIKARLIHLQKLQVSGGLLHNKRASCETLAGVHRVLKAANAAHAKHGNFDRVVSIPKDLSPATAHALAAPKHLLTTKRRDSVSATSTDAARESDGARRMREHLAELARKKRMGQ